MAFDSITLQSFLAVAKHKNFTKAGLELGRTQPAISQQITKLEDFLGKKLFNREENFILTPEGEIFFQQATKILRLQNDLVLRLRKPQLQGKIRFGVPEDFATLYLSEVLAEFSNIHPRVVLNIECDLTLNLFERFKKKQFDLVLVKMAKSQDFPNGVNVLSESLKWVGIGNELNFNKKDFFLPLVLSPKPCVYRARAIETLKKAEIKNWRLVYSSPSYAGTIAAVRAGLGITVLPKNMIPQDLQIIENKHLPSLHSTHISLLKHENNEVTKSLEEFVLKRLKKISTF